MPELLSSAKLAIEKGQSQVRNETYVKQLTDYIIPALVEALHKVLFLSGSSFCSECYTRYTYYLFVFSTWHLCLCIFSIVIYLQEPEVEICASMLDSLNECLQVSVIHHQLGC